MGEFAEKVNTSPKQKKIKVILEDMGHTNVEVWWETLGSAPEMCGNDGGYFFRSDQNHHEPLGYSFNEAVQYIASSSYFNVPNKKIGGEIIELESKG